MPIPLILGAGAALASAYAVYKGVDAATVYNNTEDIKKESRSLVKSAKKKLKAEREATYACLTVYGECKLRAFSGVIPEFIETYGRLEHVDLTSSPELDPADDFPNKILADLRQDYLTFKEAGLGLTAGLGNCAAQAFGAYNSAMLLDAASAGAAISALSGVTATNPTIARPSSAALEASDDMVQAVLWPILGADDGLFEARLDHAKSNLEEAETYRDEVERVVGKLKTIKKTVLLANTTFSGISARLQQGVDELKAIIENDGEDFSSASDENKSVVFRSVKLAQLLKAMLDTPILDENGALARSTEQRIHDIAAVANGEKATRKQVAMALCNKGIALRKQSKYEEAIALFDDIIQRFGDDQSPDVREVVAKALGNKSYILAEQRKFEKAFVGYDEALRRLGDDDSPSAREFIARVLYNKCYILEQQSKDEEAITLFDNIIQRFGDDQSPDVREVAASALLHKGYNFRRQGKVEEEIAAYDEIVRRFDSDESPAMRERVVKALRLKNGEAEDSDNTKATEKELEFLMRGM